MSIENDQERLESRTFSPFSFSKVICFRLSVQAVCQPLSSMTLINSVDAQMKMFIEELHSDSESEKHRKCFIILTTPGGSIYPVERMATIQMEILLLRMKKIRELWKLLKSLATIADENHMLDTDYPPLAVSPLLPYDTSLSSIKYTSIVLSN